MAMWPSWPQACILPSWCEAYAAPVRSVTGSASMSVRTAVARSVPLSNTAQSELSQGVTTVQASPSSSRRART